MIWMGRLQSPSGPLLRQRQKSVRIQEAEVLRNKIHYNNEMYMYFKNVLTKMKSTFTGFEDNNEILTEAQKILQLSQKLQIPSLTQVKNALQVSYDPEKE